MNDETDSNKTTAITGASDVQLAHVLTIAHALAVEINTGMGHSKGSVLAAARRQGLTTKRTKKGALEDVVAKLKEAVPDYEPSNSIKRALDR